MPLAGKTSSARPYGLGARRSPPDARDYRLVSAVSPAAIPDQYVVPQMARVPVLDQGLRSTCVSHATISARFAQLLQSDDKMPPSTSSSQGAQAVRADPPLLSREFLYDLCKQRDGYPHEEGTFPRVALQVLRELGSCPEPLRPYAPQDPPDLLTFDPTPLLPMAQPYRIAAYARLASLMELQTAILLHGPVLLAIPVTTSFFRPSPDGLIPPPSGQDEGGHALCCFGWTAPQADGRRYLWIRNSWGSSWGKEGNALLPIDWPELWEDCWVLLESPSAAQPPQPPQPSPSSQSLQPSQPSPS